MKDYRMADKPDCETCGDTKVVIISHTDPIYGICRVPRIGYFGYECPACSDPREYKEHQYLRKSLGLSYVEV